METCEICNQNLLVVGAVVNGHYYSRVCRACLLSLEGNQGLSSGHHGYEARRNYEDYAQDTVQPYNAIGPNVEFYRLYPRQAEKIFTKEELEEVKRKL